MWGTKRGHPRKTHMNTTTLFSSKKHDWATPQDLFNQLDAEFGFTLDAAATDENAKVHQFIGPSPTNDDDAQDGLTADWQFFGGERGAAWCNPPYGRTTGDWVRKGYETSLEGMTVVMLVPARTDTKWFHQWALKGELRFIKGRLKFGESTDAAPFPSLLIIFRPPSVGPVKWATK